VRSEKCEGRREKGEGRREKGDWLVGRAGGGGERELSPNGGVLGGGANLLALVDAKRDALS
jgi:hypothetical protein